MCTALLLPLLDASSALVRARALDLVLRLARAAPELTPVLRATGLLGGMIGDLAAIQGTDPATWDELAIAATLASVQEAVEGIDGGGALAWTIAEVSGTPEHAVWAWGIGTEYGPGV